jgi:phosphoglycolate phosphatase
VIETLERLDARGVGVAVVTNLPGWVAGPMLECLGLRGLLGPLVPYARVSKARRIRQALARLDLHVDADTWYVGDTASDARATRQAGIPFAWASYGYGPETLDEADAVLREFADVLAL